MTKLTKNQIDKLGERLKEGDITESDLRLLDEYRKSFAKAYEFVAGSLRDKLQLAPTGRPAKSTPSVIYKLQRESIRLTQMQDIAGCRLVLSDIREQDSAVAAIRKLFDHATVIDRRVNPSHGYRAIHIVVRYHQKPVEIQLRTVAQHSWAELSEKLADQLDPSLKYGGGDPAIQAILSSWSAVLARLEELEVKLMLMLSGRATAEDVATHKAKQASIEAEMSELFVRTSQVIDRLLSQKDL